MAITEAEMSLEQMEQAERNGYLCVKCQSPVNIAWSAKENCYILRCGVDINHTGITRHDKKEEQKRREYFSMDSTALMTMTETKMMERVNMGRYPKDLTVAEKKVLAQVAITYGFDPLMGEITIYEGRPYVSIDGRYRKAQETGRLDGVATRPATKQEREDWQIPEGDYFFKSEIYVKGSSRPFVGWGRVRASETKPGSRTDTASTYRPIQNNPQRMTEKRAEAQGLRKAFHIPLPSFEDIGSPDYDMERVVDTATGAITEGQVQGDPIGNVARKEMAGKTESQPEPKPSPQPTKSTRKPTEKVEGSKPAESAIDMDWLKESLETLQWTTVGKYLKDKYGITGSKISETVEQLNREQQEEFARAVQDRLDMS